MSGTLQGQDLAGYRDEVTELIKTGEPFGSVEDAIDDLDDLTTDQKAALWGLAFSLDPGAGCASSRFTRVAEVAR